ncbi:MAG: NUDIX hydrolase [Anaerolineales bacterium]|nr:NUDIX hydrolase [Anaerolineales bacterium]
MTVKPWKVRGSRHIQPRFRIDDCELPTGKHLDAIVFEFRSWANILAVTKDNQAVLIRQYRHGVQDVMWEIPGGVVEDGEDPSEGVRRELLEETGYVSSKIIPLGKFYPNPALQTNSMFCYLALDAEKIAEQHLDGAEEIEVHLVPLDEILPMIQRGDISHALQVAALFHALLYLKMLP